ncbi:hypothetical protein CHS0354_017993 [Potamilus streckersoni]|uniref:Peptidase C45 hydrolase domain-containing protein n=1 Tax=Potamilus streckersoni TaxID=2493646 RepID=A0AAE0RV22_9BIVA|nr:hypothetical protein CHS0354_017993 [Potamilus streckersoni]
MASSNNSHILPLLFTRGTHYEVGYSIGSVFKDRIRKYFHSSSHVQSRLLRFYDTQWGRDIFAEYLVGGENCFPQYLTEIRGIADGCGMSFEHIFLLNISKEVYNVHLAEMEAKLLNHVHGCSTVFLNRPDIKILAHNEDCDPAIRPYGYLVNVNVIEPGAKSGTVKCNEEHFFAFSYPGTLPGNAFGCNKHGLIFSINSLSAKNACLGSPTRYLINRALMSASSVDEVIRIARNHDYGSAYGYNINLASLNKKEMWSIEVAPGKTECPLEVTNIDEQHDVNKPCHYFHFNHYQHLKGIEERSGLNSTFARAKRAEQIAPPRNVKEVKTILGDTQNSNYPIFRRPSTTDDATTVYTGVFDILQETVEVYAENPNTSCEPLVKLPLSLK